MSRRGVRGRRWTRWSREEAAGMVSRWEQSGLDLRSFCAQEGIQPARLRRWQARIAESSSPRAASVRLHEVQVVPEGRCELHGSCGITLERPDGMRLHLDAGFDRAALGRVLEVLDARR